MREVATDKGVFKVWETDKELPIDRFQDYQKYLVQAVGIGSNMNDVNNHFSTLDVLLSNNRLADAQRERYNLHYNLFLALEGIQIDHLAFACFVHSVNGEEITDHSEEGLKEICKKLAVIQLGRGQLLEVLTEVKKKSIDVLS
jgi:hypothetical protein